jgi:predicted NBD/HSP70 family sugar kinase
MVVSFGIDAGGSRTKLWNPCAEQETVVDSSLSQLGLDEVQRRIKKLLEEQFLAGKPDVVGIAIPCAMSMENGRRVVVSVGNKFLSLLKGRQSRPVQEIEEEMSNSIQKHTLIMNDMEALAYDYEQQNLAADEKNVVMISIGTSVGVGFILDGRAVTGGPTTELSHMMLKASELQCDVCGKYGCWKTHIGREARIAKLRAVMRSNESDFLTSNEVDLFEGMTAPQKQNYTAELGRSIALGLKRILSTGKYERVLLTGGGISYVHGIASAVKCAIEGDCEVVENAHILGCRGASLMAAKAETRAYLRLIS